MNIGFPSLSTNDLLIFFGNSEKTSHSIVCPTTSGGSSFLVIYSLRNSFKCWIWNFKTIFDYILARCFDEYYLTIHYFHKVKLAQYLSPPTKDTSECRSLTPTFCISIIT